MKLNYITFMVRDIEKTISFYQDFAGLKIMRRFNPGPGEIVFMTDENNCTALEFIQFAESKNVSTEGMTMSFHVVSGLEELRERLKEAGFQPSQIVNDPPKPMHFAVPDPDKILVEFSL